MDGLTATMYTFDVALSGVDHGVYESLNIKAACHPSEAEDVAARVLAYCMEYKEGIAFSKGISDPDVPAISVRDLTGAIQSWIEMKFARRRATPHKASKASPRVAVYAQGAADILARVRRREDSQIQIALNSMRWTASCSPSSCSASTAA